MYQPGERWHYSTSNDWLSLVIEAVSGQHLESYFQEHIFACASPPPRLSLPNLLLDRPLAITDMSFIPNPARIDMAVDPVPPETEYSVRPIDFTPKSQRFGGTGLQGSPKSYMRLLRLLLCGGTLDGQQILKRATVDTMFESHLATPELRAEMGALTKNVGDPFSRREQKVYEGISWGYGGLLSGEGMPSGRGKGAMTWAGYANTFWVVDRAKDVAFGEPFLKLRRRYRSGTDEGCVFRSDLDKPVRLPLFGTPRFELTAFAEFLLARRRCMTCGRRSSLRSTRGSLDA